MTEELEQTAQKIAERGREALIERLRPAFRDAAAQHADVLELNDEQLEEMVQRAADRADGLQWRRALASVAAEQLDIGLSEALSHPAVARAQAIVGAPSYEESLAALAARREAQAETKAKANGTVDHEHLEAPEAIAEPETGGETEAIEEFAADEPEAVADEPEVDEPEVDEPDPPVQPTAEHQVIVESPDSIRVAVIHLGGVANLDPGERDIELRLSEVGLDILRGMDETLGRLTWPDIRELSVPQPRGLRLRRRETRAHLVVRTDNGDASFEVPAVAPEELRDHLSPLIERHGQAIATT